jgi:hypothetical protein
MSTKDYTPLVADLWAAFQTESFEWVAGDFEKVRTMDAGTFARPRLYVHVFRVSAHQKTRDALAAHGYIEQVPDGTSRFGGGIRWRLTAKTCFDHQNDDRTLSPSWKSWRAHHDSESTSSPA